MDKKYKHPANPDRVRAENERRRSSAAQPHESRNKRLRTDERVIAAELKDEEVVPRCSKCGSPDHDDTETSIARGLEESAAGDVYSLGSFEEAEVLVLSANEYDRLLKALEAEPKEIPGLSELFHQRTAVWKEES